MNPKYITSISELDNLVGLAPKAREKMETVTDLFPFRSNEYYLSLIDWKDGHDPLRRIVVPDPQELKSGGSADPSCEKDYTKQPGLQHKYDQTGLLLLTDVCGGICRFCFRKRLFMSCERETVKDVSENIEYIREHKEITNVLLTGGDPLTLETRQLEPVLRQLREIPHVNIIRIGSKMLAYNPYRILNDPNLLYVLSRYSTPEKRIYLMAHFNHPRELTEVSIQAAEALRKAGVMVVSQTPILNGINNDPETLTTLFRKLSFAGISPYYVFQCRPTTGNQSLPGAGRAVLRDYPEILAGLFRARKAGTVRHVPCNGQDRDGRQDCRACLHAVPPGSRSGKHREVHGLSGRTRWPGGSMITGMR